MNDTFSFTVFNKNRENCKIASDGIATACCAQFFLIVDISETIPTQFSRLFENLLVNSASPLADLHFEHLFSTKIGLKLQNLQTCHPEVNFLNRPAKAWSGHYCLRRFQLNQKAFSATQPWRKTHPNMYPKWKFQIRDKTVERVTENLIDWVMGHLASIIMSTELVHSDLSDHKIQLINLSISQPDNLKETRIPNKKNNFLNCLFLSKVENNLPHLLFLLKTPEASFINLCTSRGPMIPTKSVVRTFKRSSIYKRSLFSGNSRQSFRLLNWLTILNPRKREGRIMSCFRVPDGGLETDSEKIQLSCLERMTKTQIRCPYNSQKALNMKKYLVVRGTRTPEEISSGKVLSFDAKNKNKMDTGTVEFPRNWNNADGNWLGQTGPTK